MFEGPVELRLPASAEYQSVVGAVLTALGGRLGITYDRIVELRTAVTELFSLAVAAAGAAPADSGPLLLQICVLPDRVEVTLAQHPENLAAYLETEPALEGLALVQSLVDEMDRGARLDERPAIRLVKYRAPR